MPIDFSFDHVHRIATATAHGIVGLQDLLDYFDAVTINDAASYRKLFDARAMIPQFSDDDFMIVAARVSAYMLFDPRGAVAAVATTPEATVALRRYANFHGNEDRPMRLFETLEAARVWLDRVST